MKSLSFYAIILFSIFSFSASYAQTVKKETIKVWGNCGMCKTKIEKAAKSAGATTANWNAESKELNVSYTENKSSTAKIQEAIAKTGYDTQDLTADDMAYEKLPACCHYDRKGAATNTSLKKCCESATCKNDAKTEGCKDMGCCKDKACCKESTGSANNKMSCDMAKSGHDTKSATCKGMADGKDKSVCKGMGAGKKVCDMASCKKDGKMEACKGMTADKKNCDMASCKKDGKMEACKGMSCCKEKTATN